MTTTSPSTVFEKDAVAGVFKNAPWRDIPRLCPFNQVALRRHVAITPACGAHYEDLRLAAQHHEIKITVKHDQFNDIAASHRTTVGWMIIDLRPVPLTEIKYGREENFGVWCTQKMGSTLDVLQLMVTNMVFNEQILLPPMHIFTQSKQDGRQGSINSFLVADHVKREIHIQRKAGTDQFGCLQTRVCAPVT